MSSPYSSSSFSPSTVASSTIYPTLFQSAVVATAFKILLFPAYKSTDFEVHRNWLAITHSLPIQEWYYEKTSEWTLDYPPFFAYFEWLLSQVAQHVDAAMLQIAPLNYASWETVVYQRATVIVSELFLLYALHVFIKLSPLANRVQAHTGALAVFLSPGLLIIDHIHFQYNGFMYGILVLSLVYAQQQQHPKNSAFNLLCSGALFAILICLKHIYLYLAPAYFVYLLRALCLSPLPNFPYYRINWSSSFALGATIITVFGVCFGPFVLWGQMPQVLSQLFPFSRGLCHAYWAPNVWALYSFADRLLLRLAPFINLPVSAINSKAMHSITRGLVGDSNFAVLPAVTPMVTFSLTLASQIPALISLFFRPGPTKFLSAVTLSAYSSFLFGWHVHEKAILLVLLPFSLLCSRDRRNLAPCVPLAVSGHVSLFPLLFQPEEWLIKVLYLPFWVTVFWAAADGVVDIPSSQRTWLLDRFSVFYILGAIALVSYTSFVHDFLFAGEYEFVPLILTSVYCAVGVVASWVGFMVVYFTS